MPALTEEQKGKLQEVGKFFGPTTNYGAGSGLATLKSTDIKTPRVSQPGVVRQAVDKAKAVVGQSVNLVKQGTTFVTKEIAGIPNDIYQGAKPLFGGLGKVLSGQYLIEQQNSQTQLAEIGRTERKLLESYKSGYLTKEEYNRRMNDVAYAYSTVANDQKRQASEADRGNVIESAALTAGAILSTESLNLELITGRTILGIARKDLGSLLTEQATSNGLERLALRIPGVKNLLIRNLVADARVAGSQTVAGYLARSSKQFLADMIIKRPTLYNMTIKDAQNTLVAGAKGEYGEAAKSASWLAAQVVAGGMLGAADKFFGGGHSKLRALAYGKGSFIDELAKRGIQGMDDLEGIKKEGRIWRLFQESNMQVANENPVQAVDNFLSHYIESGVDLSTLTRTELEKSMIQDRAAEELFQAAAKAGKIKGVSPEAAKRYTTIRWDQRMRDSVGRAFIKVGPDVQERYTLLNELVEKTPHAPWHQNDLLFEQVKHILETEQTGKDIRRAIQSIDAAGIAAKNVPKVLTNKLASLGRMMGVPKGGRLVDFIEDAKDTRKLVTEAIEGADETFDAVVHPNPALNAVVRRLDKMGIGLVANNKLANRVMGEAVTARLDNTAAAEILGIRKKGGDVVAGGEKIMDLLQQGIENKRAIPLLGKLSEGKSAVTDIRQLRIRDIQRMLSYKSRGEIRELSRDAAKEVYDAVVQAYKDVPLDLRGAGDRLVDHLYANRLYNPFQKYYSRIQSAMRYTYNPFFRAQERTETKILSHAQASNLIWNKSNATLDAGVKVLEDAHIFTGVLPGEAAQQQVIGRITANISKGQKRDLAGLAYDLAEKRGISIEQLAARHNEEVDDLLRVVVQYPKSGFISSPLARTLNMVFFPMRYNLKVTMLAAQTLAKQPAAIQKAVLHSGFQFSNWLKSDEGIAWQAANQDAIQVFNWITPVNSIEYTFGLLNGVSSIGELGALGGLPLGYITQILDGQGIINLNKPYVNPKTGAVIPDYIPETTKARAATALADVLNTMFTYPGRVLGLPGKESSIRKLVNEIVTTSKSDFEMRADPNELTPLQLNTIRVLQGDTSKEALDALYQSPAPGEFNWYTIPPLSIPNARFQAPKEIPVLTKTQVAAMKSATKSSKVKRGKIIARPMPGR